MTLNRKSKGVVLFFLFLFSISFANQSGVIIAGILTIYLLFHARWNVQIDIQLFLLFIFSIFYFLCYLAHWEIGVKEMVIFLITPWAGYFFGRDTVERSGNTFLRKMILVLALGFYSHGILNLLSYLKIYGFNYQWRIAYDFWQRKVISTTGCGLYYVPLVSMCVGALFDNVKLWEKALALLAIAGGVFASTIFSNRTLIYIIAILLFLGILRSIFLERKPVAVRYFHIVLLLFFGAMVLVIWKKNIFGMREELLQLKIVERFLNSSSRIPLWFDFLSKNPFQYPFGGKNVPLLNGAKWVHNLWLDVLNDVGVIPFLSLSVVSLLSVMSLVRFNLIHHLPLDYPLNACSFTILGIFLCSAVEPIFEANPYIFVILMICIGGMQGSLNLGTAKKGTQNEYHLHKQLL